MTFQTKGGVSARTTPGWRRLAYVAASVAVIAGAIVLLSGHKAPAQPPPAAVVTVAQPLVRTVNQWDDYVGRFAASQAVDVRPRVSGAVTAVHFKDGQMVQKGQLLFTIDPRPFTAALNEAKAGAASAASTLALAKSDYARAARLTGDEALAANEIDALRARVLAAEAGLAAAQARVQSKTLDMEFTQVRAPIAGRVSDRRIDAGNLVAGGEGASATLLTTVNALDPIYFDFDASEALHLKTQRAGHNGPLPVEIRLQDETSYRWKGVLDFTDNGIDARSGTIRGRATLTNASQFLTPGMFGNMRLATGAPAPAILIPDAAVQNDQAQKLVLVVGPDNVVAARTVVLGPQVDGLRVVRSGLAANERVVIGGGQGAPVGTKVQTQRGAFTPRAQAQAPASPPPAAQATFAAN